MNIVELGTLMYLIKEADSMKNGVLPDDYIESEANEADTDLKEDFEHLNLLNSKLKVAIQSGNQTDVDSLLVEAVALVSGIEGLFRNVTDDIRDVFNGLGASFDAQQWIDSFSSKLDQEGQDYLSEIKAKVNC